MSANSDNELMGSFVKGQKTIEKDYDPKMDDLSAFETFVPPDTIQMQTVSDTGKVSITQEEYEEQPPIFQTEHSQLEEGREKNRPDMPYDHTDEILFAGGPAKSELESWKKQFEAQGLDIWIVDDLPTDQVFLYRDMNRYEYKAIMATPNTDALMREELICEQCVLYPYDFSYAEMSTAKAGIVSILSQHIMGTSGFTKASMPRRL